MDIKNKIDDTFVETGIVNGNNPSEMIKKADEVKDKLVTDNTEINELKISKKRVKNSEKKKKIEATEATGASSAGAFSGPAIWAKDKKNWRGAAKPQYPGGKFVTIKSKCKKFPYCNQGDIKALKIFENELLREVISEISEEFNINYDEVEKILIKKIKKNHSS